MDFLACLDWQKAQDVVAQALTTVAETEKVELLAAQGRITAADIRAQEDVPPFSRSTVDGYAVSSADTFGASEAAAALLELVGEIHMGQEAALTLAPGQAAAIPTGGMLPAGADAVVMLEYAEQPDERTLLVQKKAAPHENVLTKGEDAACGEVIFENGVRLGARHIGLLAACGCQEVLVRKRLKVGLISSGDELVDLAVKPAAGQVRDVNSYALSALLSEMGCEVARFGIVKDSYERFCECLAQAIATCQLVVISGGSSVGAKDFTVPALQAIAKPGLLFHGLAIKPGKPTIFAMDQEVPIFGLPGHPVAAFMVCSQLVAQAVRRLAGERQLAAASGVPAVLSRNLPSAPGRDDFVSVRLVEQGGSYVAEPILGKSGLIGVLAQADGILHIPAEKSGLYQGEKVMIQTATTGKERCE